MAFFIRTIKAWFLKHKWKHYQVEKAIGLYQDESDSDFFSEKKPHKSWLYEYIRKIKAPNTKENLVFKSLFGFIGGVVLTYIIFLFLHIGVSFSLKTTTYVCFLLGVFLTLGLAFSQNVRCYVLLVLPVFFTKQGRQALLTYALFLAFTGPARNTMHNMAILTESMTCGQEIVKRTLKQIYEMVKAPFKSVKETLEKMTKALKDVINTVKTFIMKIKRIIVSILTVIKKATSWLGSIINFCNKKIGTPFQRCMKTFDDAITDCKAKLGVMDFLCHVVHIVKALCYTVKWLDFICMFTEFVSDKIIGVVKRKLREFSLQMKNLFYVSLAFSHTYEFETKASVPTKEVAKTIIKEIVKKIQSIQTIFSFFGFLFSFMFLLILFQVYYYRYKYLSSDRYDNIYISNYIVDLDIKRAQMDRETVLPLERREKKKYGKPTSIRLLQSEVSRMRQSMFFLGITTFKIMTFLFVDYSLFWVLITIYEAGYDVLEEVEKTKFGLHVEGKGILANFYRNLGKAFEVPENPSMRLTPLHCLPDPVTPDKGRYLQIGTLPLPLTGFLVGLCWLLTMTEPYGLRLRNVVMSYYYPERAKERAIWLYNHILRTRGSFLRYARRQLRRKFGGENLQPVEKVTFAQRLFANFPLLSAFCGKNKENNCLLCGASETDNAPLKRCRTPDCPGRYCLNCFATLENVCTICQHPIDYGDISDISDEIDSSDEEYYNRRPRKESDESSSDDKFMTFKELELRDRFKDVEANKLPDYAKLGDLIEDKEVLRQRIRDVLRKRMENVRAEKKQRKRVLQQQLKTKLQNILLRTRKPAPKKSSLRKSSSSKSASDENDGLLVEKPKRVSFKVEGDERPALNYKTLKDELKKKLESLKTRKEKLSQKHTKLH